MRPAAPLIVLEGIDGSGKGTQAARLHASLTAEGLRVGRLAFPQYEANRFGRLIGRFLNGEFGELSDVAPELAALLFAGDRLESAPRLRDLRAAHDVVLLDRYVGSNVAHQAGRCDGPRRDELIALLDWLEHEQNALPRPTLTVWLDLPTEVARRRVTMKDARAYTEREADIQEADGEHLRRAADVYRSLCDGEGWTRIDTVPQGRELSEDEVAALVREAVDSVLPPAPS